MKRMSLFLLLAISVLVLETILSGAHLARWQRPDLLLILVVLWAWERGWKEGVLAGFAMGMVSDVLFSPLLGVSAFSLSLAGYVAAEIRERVYEDNVLVLLMTVGLTSLAGGGSALLLSSVFRLSSLALVRSMWMVFTTAAYNMGIAFLIALVRGVWRERSY